jgi:hypothetical protein
MTLLETLARAQSLLRDSRPAEALVVLDAALDLDGADWRLWHLMSEAHRARNDLGAAVTAAVEGLARNGPEPHLVDLLFVYLARSGRGAEAVSWWSELGPHFRPRAPPAANTLAHLVVCFIQAGRQADALEQFAVHFEAARGTSQSRPGLMEFNASCLYALEGRSLDAARWAARALEHGYQAAEFDDADFAAVRESPVFETLLSFTAGGLRSFEVREAADRRVVIFGHARQLERLEWTGGQLVSREQRQGAPIALVEQQVQWLAACDASGLVRGGYDFVTPWRAALEGVFVELAGSASAVSVLELEWNFGDRDGLMRDYSLVEPRAFPAFAELPQLPTRAQLAEVLAAARESPSFGMVPWAPKVRVVHAEHDAGEEFVVELG